MDTQCQPLRWESWRVASPAKKSPTAVALAPPQQSGESGVLDVTFRPWGSLLRELSSVKLTPGKCTDTPSQSCGAQFSSCAWYPFVHPLYYVIALPTQNTLETFSYLNFRYKSKGDTLSYRDELLDALVDEIIRIWGDDGFTGDHEQYNWLLQHYGVTEEEDNTYLDILEYREDSGFTPLSSFYTLNPEEQRKIMSFVNDDAAVCKFLAILLDKYKSNSICFV